MRISDWSSDVCSSDLAPVIAPQPADGAGLFAQLAFGHRDHRHLRNGGMAQQRRLHLGRVDVESAANDLVLDAADHPDAAVLSSAERRVGQECVSTLISRSSPSHSKTNRYLK